MELAPPVSVLLAREVGVKAADVGLPARGVLAARETGARTVTVLATMALERILDVAAILLLALLVSWKMAIPDPVRLAAISFAWAVAVAVLLFFSLLLLTGFRI